MENSTTAINDLQISRSSSSGGGGGAGKGPVPENITYQIGGELPPPIKIEKGKGELNATVYCPIDIHPPPYGGPSNQVQGGGQQGFSFSDNAGVPTGEYPVKNPLPSRDIPQNTLQYMDDQIRANYIPPSRGQNRDFLELDEPKIKEHRRKKYRKKILEDFLEESQTPLLLAVLFFLFSVPFVTDVFQKYILLYLPGLFNNEGFLNMYGLVFKALLFGGVYYALTKLMDYF